MTTEPPPPTPSSSSSHSQKHSIQIIASGLGDEMFKNGLPNDRNMLSASALVNVKYNDLEIQVLQAFMNAGASYLLTGNHHITPGTGFAAEEIREYTRLAGRLATKARQLAGKENQVTICGTLPPLMPSIRSDRIVEIDQGKSTYLLIGESLWPYVDLYMAETMSSLGEAKMAYSAIEHLGKPVMISFALNSAGELRSGESVVIAMIGLVRYAVEQAQNAQMEQLPLQGILFNCSQAEDIAKALQQVHEKSELKELLQKHDIQLGGFADRISPTSTAGVLEEQMVAGAIRSQLDVEVYNRFSTKWIEYGATLVGGCCGIGPEYIRSLHHTLTEEHLLP